MSAQSILANVRDKRHRQWSVSFAGPNKRHCYEVCTENTVAESCCSFPKRAGQRERQGEIRAIRVPHLPMISPNVEEHLSIRNMCAAPASALNSDHVGTHVWRGWHHWKRNQRHQKETTISERFGVRKSIYQLLLSGLSVMSSTPRYISGWQTWNEETDHQELKNKTKHVR
jgi:hypothetical protein